MPHINFLALLAAAFSSMAVGFIWYHPKVFGTAWMRETNLDAQQLKAGNMLKIFGLSTLFAIMIAWSLQFMVIHQFGAVSMTGGFAATGIKPSFAAFMADYGTAYRTFKHGAFHGTFIGLLFALPMVGTQALFERKSFTYIFINSGYWLVCFAIMGGIICAWQ